MHLQLFSLCRALRDLHGNQLNGTIPPQLGNLTMLQALYAQNRIALHWHWVLSLISHYCFYLWMWCIFNCSHCASLSLSQVAFLESAQWHYPTSSRQPHDTHPFVRSESHRPPLAMSNLTLRKDLISHICLLYSLIWHYFWHLWIWFIFNCAHFIIDTHCRSPGISPGISSLALSHRNSAASLNSDGCTLIIASPSIGTMYFLCFHISYDLWFAHNLLWFYICIISDMTLFTYF